MTKFSYNDFLKSYTKHKESCASYRLGQHFINLFIEDSSTPFHQKLWNADLKLATEMIVNYITDNQWDWYDLPLREYLI